MKKLTVEVGQCWTFTESGAGLLMVLYIVQEIKGGFQTLLMSGYGNHVDVDYEWFKERKIREEFEYNDLAFLVCHGSPQEVLTKLISKAQRKERQRIRQSNKIIKGLKSIVNRVQKNRKE